MKSKWQEWKEKNGTTPLDLVNPNSPSASAEESERRLSICYQCPELISLTKQCKKCGCIMPLKVKLEASRCPLGKW